MSFAPLKKQQTRSQTHRTTAASSKPGLKLGSRGSSSEISAAAVARFGPEHSPTRDDGHSTSTESALSPSIATAIEGELGGGEPLPDSLRGLTPKNPRRASFDRVRYHHDSASDSLARELAAPAFSVNSHIFFASGQYAPTRRAGKRLLAHELLHATEHAAGTVRRAPPEEAVETEKKTDAVDFMVPRFVLDRIDDLPTIVPDGAGWRVRFPTDQVWEYEPKTLVLAAYVAVGRKFLASQRDLISEPVGPMTLPLNEMGGLPLYPRIKINEDIPAKEIEAAAAQLMATKNVRDFGPQYQIDPNTRAHIDITIDLDAVLRLQAQLGAVLSREGEREVRSARVAQFLEDALLFASVELSDDIYDLIEPEELEELGIGGGMVFSPWAVGGARRFAARKMQGTLVALPFARAFSSKPDLVTGARPTHALDFVGISLPQWKRFVLAAAKEVRAQYEKQTAERMKQLEDEARADLLGAHELSAIKDLAEWAQKQKNENAKTTIDLGVLGQQEVRGGDEFWLQGTIPEGIDHVLVLDIVGDQVIYLASNNKAYTQHKAGFGELIKYSEVIRHAGGSDVVLRELKDAEMLLLKALFPNVMLVQSMGIMFLQAGTVFGRDFDEMQRQWSLLRTSIHYTYENFPGVFVTSGAIFASLVKATVKEELIQEFFDSAVREESFAKWLRALLILTSRMIGGRGWTSKSGMTIIKQMLLDLKTTLWAEAAAIRPWVEGYVNKENIDDLIRLSKDAIVEAAPEIPEDLAVGLSAQLSDIATEGLPDTSWDEFVKEVEAGAAAAAELAELLGPLMKTL